MMNTTTSEDEASPRERLQDACDRYALHNGRCAALQMLRSIASVDRLADVADDKIPEIIQAVKQDRIAAQETKRAAIAARRGY